MSVDKIVKREGLESPAESRGSEANIFARPYSARVAWYCDGEHEPQVFEVSSRSPGKLLEQLADKTRSLAGDGEGAIPGPAIKEIVDNLVHADFTGITVTILDSGHEIRIADRGCGISEKKKVMARGYTTAGDGQRTIVRGVGSGLSIAYNIMTDIGGSLEIDDNLCGGSVIVLKAPPARSGALPTGNTAPEKKSKNFPLTKRQKKVFFIIIELGAVGPSRIAAELSVGLSTVYRDLGALDKAGLIKTGHRGNRTLTPLGLRCVDSIMNS